MQVDAYIYIHVYIYAYISNKDASAIMYGRVRHLMRVILKF
jgi:hypothetical protein